LVPNTPSCHEFFLCLIPFLLAVKQVISKPNC
jgi:hypothetical protein